MMVALIAGSSAMGATVIWNAFEQSGNSFYYYGGPTPEINFAVEVHPSVIVAKAEGPVNIANPRAYWVVANAGDVVDDDFLFSPMAHIIFDAYYTDRTEVVGYSVAAMKDSTFYLALIVDDADYYGWLAIDVDGSGELHLAHSALSTEPGIVVGAIPEPASAASDFGVCGVGVKAAKTAVSKS